MCLLEDLDSLLGGCLEVTQGQGTKRLREFLYDLASVPGIFGRSSLTDSEIQVYILLGEARSKEKTNDAVTHLANRLYNSL